MKNKAELYAAIKNWRDYDEYALQDIAVEYFEMTELADWVDIAKEATRLLGVDDLSFIDIIINAACAQVERGVICAMAKMMSVDDPQSLQMALSSWIESDWANEDGNDGCRYKPIQSDNLNRLIECVMSDFENDTKEDG